MNISLIIPTYRNPAYLDICLKSAIENKEYPDTEIIVVVDGYYNESKDVLIKYADDILVLDLETNRGMAYALNAGVAQAKNEYVFIINDDNVLPVNWDDRLIGELRYYANTHNDRIILTVNQVEPHAPGMFNFVTTNEVGTAIDDFNYKKWLQYELTIIDDEEKEDGHIFPFLVKKQYYMAVGGFDLFYNSPNIVDWDHFLKYELLKFKFPRTRRIHLYHFGSVATKKNSEKKEFIEREARAFEEFKWKWGFDPYNDLNNKKFPKGTWRGITLYTN